MKKALALLLAVLMLMSLVLTGCGGSKSDKFGEVSERPKVDLPDAQVATQAPETEPPATEKPVSIGRMVGGVYTNSYAGFGVELDSNWTFLTAEELQELPTDVNEQLGYGDLDIPQIMDMQAENLTDYTSMNVLYQELTLQQQLVFATYSEEELADEVLATADDLIASYANAGITVLDMKKVQVEFMGEMRWAIHTTASYSDVPYYMLQFMDYSLGKYSVTLTLASFFEDRTDDLMDLFFVVE